MSYSFDVIEGIFRDRFAPKSGDEYEKHLFEMALSDMHSANHELNDGINHNSRVRKSADRLDKYVRELRNKEKADGQKGSKEA